MRAHRAASVYCSERIESPFLIGFAYRNLQNKSLVLGTLLDRAGGAEEKAARTQRAGRGKAESFNKQV
jgi:hypothetical protein